jgi:hypothetical protein
MNNYNHNRYNTIARIVIKKDKNRMNENNSVNIYIDRIVIYKIIMLYKIMILYKTNLCSI